MHHWSADYLELLGTGQVRRWIEDPSERSAWRAAMWQRARADRLPIRTFTAPAEPRLAGAVLSRRRPSFGTLQEEVDRLSFPGDTPPADWLEDE